MRSSSIFIARLVFSWLVLTVVSTFVLSGCKPSAEKIAAREELVAREVEDVLAKAQSLQAGGQVAEAISLIDKNLKTPKYKAHKAKFFGQKVDFLLAQGSDAAAGDLILATWKSEPQLAQSVFGRLYNHYQQQNNHAALHVWCKRLLDLGTTLPFDLRSQALNWQLTAALALKDSAAAQSDIDAIMAQLKPEEATAMLQSAILRLIDAGQHDLASSLTKHLSDKKPSASLYRDLIVTLSLRSVLATSDWPTFPAAFQACVAQLPDDPLLKLMRMAMAALQKNNQKELVEQSSKLVIFNALDKTNTVNYASRIWMESGVAINRKLLPERLDALLKAKVSPIQVGNLFDRYFYEMINDLDIIRSLCGIGEQILTTCSDETTVNNVKVKVLDGAFIIENYDLAVQMLEQGIPGKDKAWHDMSLPKVKAHRALAQKKPREAVQYFRDFMNCWLTSKQEEEYDPTSGIAYSREWILGRNANRIADILDSIPDKAEADKARDEARAYFKVAVEKAKNDVDAMKLLTEETKKLGL